MEYAALAAAIVALIIALSARAKAAGLKQSIEDAAADARRRIENANGERNAELDVFRKQLAKVARGQSIDEDMILEGRLWQEASTPDAVRLVGGGSACVVDVRTRAEMAAGIIPGALLIPIDELESRMREIPRDGRMTLVYCASGGRSAAACEFLCRAGWNGVLNLSGGFSSWSGPKERPK